MTPGSFRDAALIGLGIVVLAAALWCILRARRAAKLVQGLVASLESQASAQAQASNVVNVALAGNGPAAVGHVDDRSDCFSFDSGRPAAVDGSAARPGLAGPAERGSVPPGRPAPVPHLSDEDLQRLLERARRHALERHSSQRDVRQFRNVGPARVVDLTEPSSCPDDLGQAGLGD